ncbi:Pyrroline-5-carboxylate reductase [Paraburkholderia graminis C4D1M]|jgi:predicted dinucleotide-binding enzyme|uniref:NADP oxidoreductase coenzyme F420-dependent n=1 Tax=Paraburkholderia graminis (strain ATCC 700544 / DSM 17151 / LMG 18924 / NCIMB 13744 / C4D1M) TaxID=396598 RepID=B1G3B3_PARG4|nr:NADPH-dependent F420 reductase [Paraburkholderia graminis]ALE59229.1 NADP oxidoreductase [Burkholderia sp. HB1]EDT09458.1 NADP oxidoreductase coenzyme F420-dependent [Paraburkholderia graminis C4D1M]MDR6478053.1 putative dinucleotide-binding enzyme [Paraburkholderia graminis]CAB3707182.1 Pyrroline-5-carboxylate reductase [Paraburkholderia graminis C4D1M]
MSTISIIGAGTMATAVAGRIAKAGHTVEVLNRDPAKARALADKLSAGVTTGTYAAAPTGDIVILAVPYGSAAAVVADYGNALEGKVIIDITNPVAPDLSGLVTPHGSSGAQEIAKGLPATAHVVKAFNTVFGHVLAKNGRLDAFIAADDAQAKARVSTLIESLGLRPLDVGGLHMAATLEALGLMMIGLAKNGAGTWDIALNVEIG